MDIFEITSEDLTAHVMFEPEEFFKGPYPSVSGIAEAVGMGLVGVNRKVHFEPEPLMTFAEALQRLLDTGAGPAFLNAVSPGDFDLQVQAHGPKGQIRVAVFMRKWGDESGLEHTMSTGFLADRSSIQDAVHFLKRLARQIK